MRSGSNKPASKHQVSPTGLVRYKGPGRPVVLTAQPQQIVVEAMRQF
jgi:hypothetical protein